MKKLTVVLALFSLSGCVTEMDDRICLKWKTREVIKEKCIPLYGALICADEQRTESRCVLYETIEPLKEEENAS